MTTFNLDSLDLNNVLSTDEMAAIDAGANAVSATVNPSTFSIDAPKWNMHGEAIWSMIP